ncbi:Fe-S cluster assembly protein SufD, partial [Arachidicoccus sp.]|uniref:Fe-S cluster assembly protein SufD n=1 Tax=Arachidicoccus sp. TaxID=1872624 RepID=UPI003D1D60BB
MSNQIAENSLYDTLVNEFEQTYHEFEKTEQTSLLKKRKEAFGLFSENKFPTTKNEEWRFTNLSPFVNEAYNLCSTEKVDKETIQKAIDKTKIKNLEAYRLVLVNGIINFDFSEIPSSDKIIIQPVNEIKNQKYFEKDINRTVDINKFPFAALNTSFFKDGFYFEIKKNFRLDKPIQIVHIYAENENVFLQPRNIIKVAQGASCEIIETSTCVSKKIFFINSFTEIFVEENAQFKHAHFQRGNTSERWIVHTQVEQEQNSRYDNYTLTLPKADLVRNNLNVVLDGTNTETHLYGLYLVGDKHVVDNHSVVDHRFPNCQSNQLYKGVILDGGKGVFNGKIYVHRAAQKTNAFQQNNNLLFSPNATINSKPQLEIFADDVKCSHGTTVGQFNEESLFYL